MKKRLGSKEGSYIVFLAILTSSIVLLLISFVIFSKGLLVESTISSFGKLWAQNIISEYDKKLFERYGVLGFQGNDYVVNQKIDFYASYTIKGSDYMNYADIKSDLSKYSLGDGNVFLEEVKNTVLMNLKPKVTDYEKGDNDRYIRASWIINSLPSNVKEKSIDKKLFQKAELTSYLFNYFKDYVDDRDLGQTFFNNEIEYVITGKLDDEESYEGVRKQLLLLRNGLNLTYLYSSDEKRNAALMIALAVTPEAYLVTQALILEAWSLFEAENDLKLIYDGKEVPLIKSDESWATSLESSIRNIGSKEYIEPEVISGLDYEAYLKILIEKTSRDKLTYRTMDLIQINMKYTYLGTFNLNSYFTGLYYKIKVNGELFEFETSY